MRAVFEILIASLAGFKPGCSRRGFVVSCGAICVSLNVGMLLPCYHSLTHWPFGGEFIGVKLVI